MTTPTFPDDPTVLDFFATSGVPPVPDWFRGPEPALPPKPAAVSIAEAASDEHKVRYGYGPVLDAEQDKTHHPARGASAERVNNLYRAAEAARRAWQEACVLAEKEAEVARWVAWRWHWAAKMRAGRPAA